MLLQNYDSYISHVKTELIHGGESPDCQVSPVRPQIKPHGHVINTDRPKSLDKGGQPELDLSSKTSPAPPVPPRTRPGKESLVYLIRVSTDRGNHGQN